MNYFFRSVYFILIACLLVCCSDPYGQETTIGKVEDLYSKGEVESFKYFQEGSWIQVKLKEGVLRKGRHAKYIKSLMKKGEINRYSQFRFKVRIFSLEEFQRKLLLIEQTYPAIEKISITNDNE